MNYEFIKELNEKYGLTVIVIEQKIRLLCEYAKKLAVLKHGDKSAVLKAKRQRTAFLRDTSVSFSRILTDSFASLYRT